MVSTLRMRTTISPRQWQPWTAVSPFLGLMVVRMRKVLAIPRSWYVCFNAVNWYCFKFIWAQRSIFLFCSSQPTATTCLRWSWRLKQCLHSSGSKRSLIYWLSPARWPSSYAKLMSPKKGKPAIHGCHCSGDMVVRMHKVLAITQRW